MAKINKKEFEDIPRCKYAGDPGDEYCVSCNGKTMVVDGETYSCRECQAYTPEEEPVETPAEPVEIKRDDTFVNETSVYTPQGITTSIKAESGVSVETKKGWYRFGFTEERIIPESADIEKEKEALWKSVNDEVDKQVDHIKAMLNEI